MDSEFRSFKSGLLKTIEHLKSEFARLQTGRASGALVEHVLVEAYGQKQPLKALAGISIEDARTILVQPWDRSLLAAVEKALTKADLGVQPVNDGARLRLVLPQMTEERRKDLVKVVHQLAEEARISLRQQRQEVHTNVKRDASRTEDAHRDFERSVQEEVDKANKEIERLTEGKEEEVMTV